MSTIKLKNNEYDTFLNVLSVIKNFTDDLSIENGCIFQTNNKADILYDINIMNLMGTESLYFNDIKNKFSILNSLKCNNDVVFEISEKKYKIYNSEYKTDFIKPNLKSLNPQPLSKTSKRAVEIKSNSEDYIIDINFPLDKINKINLISKTLNCTEFNIIFKNDKISFCMFKENMPSLGVSYEFLTFENIPIDRYMGFCKISLDLFLVDSVGDLNLKLIHYDNNEKMSLKMNTEYNGVDVTLWNTTKFFVRE